MHNKIIAKPVTTNMLMKMRLVQYCTKSHLFVVYFIFLEANILDLHSLYWR